MQKEKSIICCKDEMTLKVNDNEGSRFLHLDKNQIKHIQIDKCTIKKFFKKIPTEKIEILLTNKDKPIVYYQNKEKHFFDEYKERLSGFAKENRIKLYDMNEL
jgi:hypothetical protein